LFFDRRAKAGHHVFKPENFKIVNTPCVADNLDEDRGPLYQRVKTLTLGSENKSIPPQEETTVAFILQGFNWLSAASSQSTISTASPLVFASSRRTKTRQR
jgi:hypothetical protein